MAGPHTTHITSALTIQIYRLRFWAPKQTSMYTVYTGIKVLANAQNRVFANKITTPIQKVSPSSPGSVLDTPIYILVAPQNSEL